MIVDQRIYKKDSSGKIRYLHISHEGHFVVQESGVVGTNNPVINRSACEAKNIGKSNATTPEHQAMLEARSKLDEKKRLGYFYTIEEAQRLGGKDFLLPMLAKDFKKEVKKVSFPCYVQPKLDGMRSLGSEDDGFMSRTGKAIDTLGHIVLADLEDNILDGELYAHGISFQENMKLIKKYRPGQTEQVKYHVYDIVMNAPFEYRHRSLCYLLAKINNPNIEVVTTVLVNNMDEINHYHQYFISLGYEGTMVRHSEEGYAVNKRSSQLLKYKDFLDEVYEVVDVIPSESRPEQGVVVCTKIMEQAGENVWVQNFNCGMKFSHADREEILANKQNYIGKMAEVRFFEYTDGGIPRFPVCVGFRLDK
jgi:DNA ligase-1